MGNSQQGPKKEQEGRLPLFDFVTTMNVTTMDVPTLNVLLLHHKGLLDQILQYSMVVFLEDSERLNLAATCKPMRRIVEGYCRSAIDKILEEHRVDDSFEQRLLPKSFASGNFPFLSRRTYPFRNRLHATKRTYLYKLDMSPVEGKCITAAMAVSKDGNVLAVAPHFGGPPPPIYIWNLQTKTCLRTDIPAWDVHFEIYEEVFCMGTTHIVIQTQRRIFVWLTSTGELLHTYAHSGYIMASVQRDETSILFNDGVGLFSFNMHTGLAEPIMRSSSYIASCRFLLAVCNDHWLVASNWKPRKRTFQELRVFDIRDGCREVSSYPGCFNGVDAALHLPNTVCVKNATNNEFQFLMLTESGQLCRMLLHPVRISTSDDKCDRFRGADGRQIFMDEVATGEFRGSLVVHSILDGEAKRRLIFPAGYECPFGQYPRDVFRSKGKEVFVRMKKSHDPLRRAAVVPELIVAAYLTNDNI